MTAQVLVSGGSGCVAGLLIRQLMAEGWRVHTAARNLRPAHALAVLDWQTRPVEHSIADTARCLLDLGLVRPSQGR